MRVIGTDEIGGPATSHLAMTTYVLIHGAASDSWYWHLVVPQLRARGHDRLGAGQAPAARAGRPVDRGLRRDGGLLPRRTAGCGRRGAREGRTGPVGHADGQALAAGGVAGRAEAVPSVQGRPLLPGRVPAPGGAGAARHLPRRDRRRTPAGAQSPEGVRGAVGGLPHRALTPGLDPGAAFLVNIHRMGCDRG